MPPAAGTTGSLDNLAANISALLAALPVPLVDPILIVNPSTAASLMILAPALASMIIQSGALPAGQLVALDAADFASGEFDLPESTVTEESTVHRETVPGAIVEGGTIATPVTNLWQQAMIGIRVVVDLSWGMRQASSVAVMTL